MKPTKILCENFKALDFTHDLKPVTAFVGPNESGKTARLDAIKVALLGYHPAVGKQPSSTFSFAGESRPEMTVHMEFDNQAFITRTFKRKSNGDVSRSNKGEIPDIPTVLFDASDYLGDTAAGRIKTVFERIDVSQIAITDDDLLARLGKIEAVPAAVSQVAVPEMIEEVKKTITRRGALKQSPQLWLEELVRKLIDTAKGEKALQDNASAQLQTLKPSGATPPKSVAEELKAERETLAELEKRKTEIDVAINAYSKNAARRESIRKELEKPVPDIAALAQQKAEIDQKIADYTSDTAVRKKYLEDLLKEHARLESGIKKLEHDLSHLNTRLTDLDGKVKCPFCKSNRQGWKDEYRIELTTQITGIEKQIAENKTQLANVADEGRKARADFNASEQADDRHRRLCVESEALNCQIAVANTVQSARAALEGELKGLEAAHPPSEQDRLNAINEANAQRTKIVELEAKEVTFNAAAKNSEKLKETESKLIGHQVRVEVYKQAAKTVMDAQKEIVSRAFESILAPARRFTDGIIDGKLDYQNDELGVQSPAGWVSHKVMSGRGQDLAYLGLQVALAQQSPIKVVILDEMSDFDKPTKLAVIQRLLDLTKEGFIDCALIADPREEDYLRWEHPDFQLVSLAKPAVE